jgi:GDPmannose 4,6-dehydratase
MKKCAVVTGITGQDGSYLSELLISEGYKVYGVKRRSSGNSLGCSSHLHDNSNFEVVETDILDSAGLNRLCKTAKPDHFYNLAAQSVHPGSIVYIRSMSNLICKPIEKLWIDLAAKNLITLEKDPNGLEIEVINIEPSSTTCILAFESGMGTFKELRQISRHKYTGNLVRLQQKWGEVCLTPNHSAIDKYGKVFAPSENREVLAARKINWNRTPYIDSIEFSGKLFSGKELENFLVFLGTFVSEGWTSYNSANGSYIVGICSQDKLLMESLKEWLINVTGCSWSIVANKKENYDTVWQVTCSSKSLYYELRRMCGKGSYSKKLPKNIFRLSNENLETLLYSLIDGDGSIVEYKSFDISRYTTSSEILACQIGIIFSIINRDYTINIENNDQGKYYHISECKSYQDSNGIKRISEEYFEGYVYDLSVPGPTNFAIGAGTVIVHNSHVASSFEQPEYTLQASGAAVLNCLEAIRQSGIHTRFYQASTSEMFGGQYGEVMCNESTPFNPRSPYGCAKLYGYHITKNYRESYKMFACSGILFNHESERRGPNFVTRKITLGIGSILRGEANKLYLGNLKAKRDWGHAKDFVKGMYLMLNYKQPEDFVLATGETHSVEEFCRVAFEYAGLGDYSKYIEIDPKFYRPAEVDILLGDASKAKGLLGWNPEISFTDLVKMMVEGDK